MRVCPICGCDMTGRSPLAATCSPQCRRERSRVAALISGRGDGPYTYLAEYLQRERHPRREAVQTRWGAGA